MLVRDSTSPFPFPVNILSLISWDTSMQNHIKGPTGKSFDDFSYQLLLAQDFAYLHLHGATRSHSASPTSMVASSLDLTSLFGTGPPVPHPPRLRMEREK
jgi:hypothetical protein